MTVARSQYRTPPTSKKRGLDYYMKNESPSKRLKEHRKVVKAKSKLNPMTKGSAPQAMKKFTSGEGNMVAKKGKKGVTIKKTKLAKVTKKFKGMVARALEPKLIRGSCDFTYTNGYMRLTVADSQVVSNLNCSSEGNGWSFTTDHFLDAASRLFNGKAGSIGPLAPTATGSFFAAAYKPLKFNVRNCYTRYNLKNNSLRTLYVKVYECAPKAKGAGDISHDFVTAQAYTVDPVTAAMTLVTEPQAVLGAREMWNKGLTDDFAEGYSSGLSGAGVLQALDYTVLDLNPGTSKNFSRSFKTNFKEYVLLPGEGFSYIIQGPTQLELDYEKYLLSGIYQNIQKFSRAVLLVVKPDIVGAATSGAGRLGDTILSEVLGFERKDFFTLEMPEIAGVATRHDSYIKAVTNVSASGAATTVEQQAPTSMLLV